MQPKAVEQENKIFVFLKQDLTLERVEVTPWEQLEPWPKKLREQKASNFAASFLAWAESVMIYAIQLGMQCFLISQGGNMNPPHAKYTLI